jgi:hypothetical protein
MKINENFLEDHLENINERRRQGREEVRNREVHELIKKKSKEFRKWQIKREKKKQKKIDHFQRLLDWRDRVVRSNSKKIEDFIKKYGKQEFSDLLKYGILSASIPKYERDIIKRAILREYNASVRKLRRSKEYHLNRIENVYGKYERWAIEQYHDPMLEIRDVHELAGILTNQSFNKLIKKIYGEEKKPTLIECEKISKASPTFVTEAISKLSKYGKIERINTYIYKCEEIIFYITTDKQSFNIGDMEVEVCMIKRNCKWKIKIIQDKKIFKIKDKDLIDLKDIFTQ